MFCATSLPSLRKASKPIGQCGKASPQREVEAACPDQAIAAHNDKTNEDGYVSFLRLHLTR